MKRQRWFEHHPTASWSATRRSYLYKMSTATSKMPRCLILYIVAWRKADARFTRIDSFNYNDNLQVAHTLDTHSAKPSSERTEFFGDHGK